MEISQKIMANDLLLTGRNILKGKNEIHIFILYLLNGKIKQPQVYVIGFSFNIIVHFAVKGRVLYGKKIRRYLKLLPVSLFFAFFVPYELKIVL